MWHNAAIEAENDQKKSGGEKGIFRIIRYGTMSDDMVNPLCAYRKTRKNK